MVVGMQHQQQQPHASPATVLEDATTPCAMSPLLAPASVTTSLAKKNLAQEKDTAVDDKSLSVPNNPQVSESSLIVNSNDVKPENEVLMRTSMEKILKTCYSNPIRSTGRVKLRDVNPHLVCVLCQGYFVDATSIAECLHSFCRSCIILSLATKNYCPICEVPINSSKPHLSLKPDKALQDIVYKLVPGLFHAEMKRRQRFYEDHPNRDLDLHPEYRGVTVDRLVYSPSDDICISLVYCDKSKEREERENGTSQFSLGTAKSAPNSDSDGDDDLPKRYLKCSAAVRVMDLKKLIRMKYSLDGENKVELFFRKESLPDDYSLMDIAYIYAWKRNSPMQLYYKICIMSAASVQSSKLKIAKESTNISTSSRLIPMLEASNSKSNQPTPVRDASDSIKSSLSKSVDLVGTAKISESFNHEAKSSVTTESSVPTQTTPTSAVDSHVTKSKDMLPLSNLSSQDRGTKLDESINEIKAAVLLQSEVVSSIPATIPMNTVTTAVHSTPRVSIKSRGIHGASDAKKCKERSPVRCSSNADASPIKSYLAISSIMNEKDKLDSKKTLLFTKTSDKKSVTQSNPVAVSASNVMEIPKSIPSATSTNIPAEVCSPTINEKNKSDSKKILLPVKNSLKKVVMSESNQIIISPSSLMKLSKPNFSSSCTSSKVPVTTTSPKSVKSLSSIVKSLTTTACPVAGKENHKTAENTKCIDVLNKSIMKEKVSNASSEVEANSSLSSSSGITCSYNNVVATTSAAKPAPSMQTKMNPAKQTSTAVTTKSATNSPILSTAVHKNLTPITSGKVTKLKQLPKLLPATANSKPTDVKTSVSPLPVSSKPVMSNGVAKTGPPISADLSSAAYLHSIAASPTKDGKSLSISSANPTTVKTTQISTVPPLITLSTTGVHTSLTNPNSLLSKKNNSLSIDPINSFILSTNAKIPSSLEISLTQPRNTSNISPMNNLQKMVQQNFHQTSNAVNSSHQQVSCGVKRGCVNSREDGPSEKYVAFSSKTTKKDNKQPLKSQLQKEVIDPQKSDMSGATNKNTPPKKVFSPDILPEVSITLNPHPESMNKRLSPETSYDVSCFKPPGVSNGIPPLTPISTHSTTYNNVSGANNTIGDNGAKSPNKRSLMYSSKDTSQCKNSQGTDEDSKIHNDVTKRLRSENGECKIRPNHSQSSILESNKPRNTTAKSDGSGKPNVIPVKKDGIARHQGIPKLININAPFAKSRLKFASTRPNFTPPNFHSADQMTANVVKQQQWIFNMSGPVPPHPLMNQFVANKPPVSQGTSPPSTLKK